MRSVTEDLEGLKVAHDFDEMEDGEERILTLKDSRILENEGAYSVAHATSSACLRNYPQRTSFRMSNWRSTSVQRRTTSSRSSVETIPGMTTKSSHLVRQG